MRPDRECRGVLEARLPCWRPGGSVGETRLPVVAVAGGSGATVTVVVFGGIISPVLGGIELTGQACGPLDSVAVSELTAAGGRPLAMLTRRARGTRPAPTYGDADPPSPRHPAGRGRRAGPGASDRGPGPAQPDRRLPGTEPPRRRDRGPGGTRPGRGRPSGWRSSSRS